MAYSEQGGAPVILVPSDELTGSGLCGYSQESVSQAKKGSSQSSGSLEQARPNILFSLGVLVLSMFFVGLLNSVLGL